MVMISYDENVLLAQQEFELQRYPLAVQFASYALACNPEDPHACRILGMSLFELGQVDEALDALEAASLEYPLGWDGQIALAICYGAIGKRSLSRDLLMRCGTSGELDRDQMLRVATGLEAIDEPTLAMEACRQAGVLDPDSARVHYRMSYYSSLCRYPVSVTEALIKHAINLEPDNIHYRVGLVSLLIRLDRDEEAIEAIESFIPSHLDEISCKCCLKRIANLFFDAGDLDRARQAAQRRSELEPLVVPAS
ncbi:MAG: tetratricopeptide repeat protein [Planctomycetota bacterium]